MPQYVDSKKLHATMFIT
uniref:Uncharacterized protein n=1 Tax=Arundo donax TaxID=35708 RepID=A0A0A9F2Z6_ARUDO